MRRTWCVVCTGWVSAVVVLANEHYPSEPASESVQGQRSREGLGASSGALRRLPEDFDSPESSQAQEATPALLYPQSPFKLLDKFARERFEHSDASSDDSTQEEHSASDDTWSYLQPEPEPVDEDAMTDADLMCPPSKFLAPVGKSRAINEASELLGAFKAFAKLKGTVNKKFVLFMTAGTGEELIGSRQMSQRLVMHPTLRKNRSGFFNPSDGVAELSDDGRIQVEILHDIFAKFVKLVKTLPPDERNQACIDAFLTSPLQSGIETCLEAFTGLLEHLSCHTRGPAAHLQSDGYVWSNVRFLVVPHLREVVEASGDVGEALPVVLKKTKNLRIQDGFQRDIFNCAIANYGLRWRKQQLGAVEGSSASSLDKNIAAIDAAKWSVDTAAANFLQTLDKLSYPKGVHSQKRAEDLRTTFAFLKEVGTQEPSVQRAVWATPEEMEADCVETDASILRRGLSLLRALCAVEGTNRYILAGHPKLIERLTSQPMDNGELMAFTLDCGALAECLTSAGFKLWGMSKNKK